MVTINNMNKGMIGNIYNAIELCFNQLYSFPLGLVDSPIYSYNIK